MFPHIQLDIKDVLVYEHLFSSSNVTLLTSYHHQYQFSMESQMVQNSKNKFDLKFNKFAIKVKRDFNQPQQNHFTFNRFSLKVKTFRFKVNKITSSLSTNFLSRDYLSYFQRKISLNFKLRSISTPNSPSHFNYSDIFPLKNQR